eukprot:6486986-Amphidinium_carterae.2
MIPSSCNVDKERSNFSTLTLAKLVGQPRQGRTPVLSSKNDFTAEVLENRQLSPPQCQLPQ